MNRYDSVHLRVPFDGVDNFDSELFTAKAELDEDGNPLAPIYTLRGGAEKPLGLAQVKISDKGADLSFSAKILGSRYAEGLSLETVGAVVPALRPIIRINADALLGADLFSIDATDNIRPKDVRRAILSVGQVGGMNGKYRFSDYGGHGQQGFVFQARAKTKDERFIGYDKVREMQGKRTALSLGIENFAGVLRIESNLRHREQMREFLGLEESYTLRDALESNRKPNALLFEKIIGGVSLSIERINRIHRVEGTGMDHIKKLGYDSLIETYGGNWRAIEKHIRLHSQGKSNPSRILKQAKERLALYHARQEETELMLEEVAEVRELLKVA
jgi:hypothetical protein